MIMADRKRIEPLAASTLARPSASDMHWRQPCHCCLFQQGCTCDIAQQDITSSKCVQLYMSVAAGVIYALDQSGEGWCFSRKVAFYRMDRTYYILQVKCCTSKARHFRRTICTLNGLSPYLVVSARKNAGTFVTVAGHMRGAYEGDTAARIPERGEGKTEFSDERSCCEPSHGFYIGTWLVLRERAEMRIGSCDRIALLGSDGVLGATWKSIVLYISRCRGQRGSGTCM
jgi:hypothetical protein